MNKNEEPKKETLERLQSIMAWMWNELENVIKKEDHARLGESCDKVFDDIEKLVG